MAEVPFREPDVLARIEDAIVRSLKSCKSAIGETVGSLAWSERGTRRILPPCEDTEAEAKSFRGPRKW